MGKYKHIITKLTEDSEYQKFFMDALKKFNVSDIGSFKSEDEKKKFFNYVDANYKGKTEGTLEEEVYFKPQGSDRWEVREARKALYDWFKTNIEISNQGQPLQPSSFKTLNDLILNFAVELADARAERAVRDYRGY